MQRINSMSRADAFAAFKACCGSTKYAEVVPPACVMPERCTTRQCLHPGTPCLGDMCDEFESRAW
jgi:hypothetical protein